MTDATRLTWLADEVERLQQRLATSKTGAAAALEVALRERDEARAQVADAMQWLHANWCDPENECFDECSAHAKMRGLQTLHENAEYAKAHNARVAAMALSAAAHGLLATLPPVGDKARPGVLLAIEALEAQAKEER